MVNNLIYNPGRRAVHYNLMHLEWVGQPFVTGEITAIGNVMRGGNDTDAGLPFFMIGGEGDVKFYARDNMAVDRHGNPLPLTGRYGETKARIISAKKPMFPLGDYTILPARDVETSVLHTAGARPWARDGEEIRILFFVAEGRGVIIDDEKEVSNYPAVTDAVRAPFDEAAWNLDTMEPLSGLYPGQSAAQKAQEHLSVRDAQMRAQ